jgi:hypothetical protein
LKKVFKQETLLYCMFEYLNEAVSLTGISLGLLIVIVIWSSIWKYIALWKAGRNNSLLWFVIFALVNTVGILEILYIFVFSKMKKNNFRAKKARKRRR